MELNPCQGYTTIIGINPKRPNRPKVGLSYKLLILSMLIVHYEELIVDDVVKIIYNKVVEVIKRMRILLLEETFPMSGIYLFRRDLEGSLRDASSNCDVIKWHLANKQLHARDIIWYPGLNLNLRMSHDEFWCPECDNMAMQTGSGLRGSIHYGDLMKALIKSPNYKWYDCEYCEYCPDRLNKQCQHLISNDILVCGNEIEALEFLGGAAHPSARISVPGTLE